MDAKKKKFSFKKLFKVFAVSVIAGVYLIIFARIFVSCDVSLVDKVLENETLISAYSSSPETFAVERYEITDWYRSIDDGKLLGLSNLYYIPQADLMQFTLKYNTDIAPGPAGQDIPFSFYLTDEDGNTYTDYFYETDSRFNFGYIRVCFEGIEFLDESGELDEDGDPIRKNYELYIERKNNSGEYEKFHSFSIYTGRKGSSKLNYTPKGYMD